MSNDTEALADIIARLEKATGADQEIDQLIAVFVSIIKNPERKVVAVANCASYTSSLDAIVGLIGRALPGAYWQAFGHPSDPSLNHATRVERREQFLDPGRRANRATRSLPRLRPRAPGTH